MYASAGFVAAFIILALRKATSIDLAGRILAPAYQMLASLPAGYQRTLENEYARAVARISATTHALESSPKTTSMPAAAPILIKKECNHADCKTTRCNYDVRIGGIAI
jgi:hypothetical protein